MNMQNQLQKLNDAVFALDGSQARKRLMRLFDEASFVEIDRLARDGDNPSEAVIGYGTVDGNPVYAFAQDNEVCCGAIGKAQASKICKVYELASQNGIPVVGVFDSDGAKLGEGVDAMDAIADILLASNNISGVVPQIAVVAGACVGSSSIVASNADIVIAAKGMDFYLNPGDDSCETDITADNSDAAIDKARELVALLPSNNLSVPVSFDFDNASMPESQGIADVINAVADPNTAIYLGSGINETVLARIGGNVCGLITIAEEKLSLDAASRIARFVRMCDSFSIPIITFVDSAGFDNLKGAAKLSHAYAEATTVKITVVVGKAYGAAYIAVAGKSAGADIVLAWPSAVILPLAPEAAIHIFWKEKFANMSNPSDDRAKLAEEYAQTEGDVLTAAANGIVSDVISPSETKSKLIAMLDMMSGKRVSRLPKKHSNMVL